jgi:glycosyltransferase involved in cell wall biosynthesis
MKICVYAISKNEAQFVERFCKSAADADLILIADTGSSDDTVTLAKQNGADVHAICISPWRFDHARNAALALVPADIDVCVSLDLDEVLEEGWREEIERVWKDGATRLRYLYDWGKGLRFKYEKIHARHGYEWHHPCHEYPRPVMGQREVWAETEKLLVSHYPDNEKSRSSYLPLLEISVKEDPSCPRNAFYYARELFFHKKYWEAITALDNYLAMPDATWKVERGYAYRVMGKCYEAVGHNNLAEAAFLRGCAEDATVRDPWFALAGFYYRSSQWLPCYAAAKRALSIDTRNYDYTVDVAAWGAEPHDLAALCAWRIGMSQEAIYHGRKALELAPDDHRLKGNMTYYLGENREAAE